MAADQDVRCPDRHTLQAFYCGRLPEIRIDEVANHIDSCTECLSVLDTLHVDAASGLGLFEFAPGNIKAIEQYAAEPGFNRFKELAKTFPLNLPAEAAAANVPLTTADPPIIDGYAEFQEIGHGGFATVYRARDEKIDRLVAVKVPKAGLRQDDGAAEFFREAQTLAGLTHPAIVGVRNWGTSDDGAPYIVMDYVQGRTLKQIFRSGRLSPEEIANVGSQIAEALHHAHIHRLFHRDVKPANILIGEDGRPYIIDFGLSMRDEHRWQHQAEFAGTRPYMSPEQVRGEAHRLDGRTDVWGLAVVLYEGLSGRLPFHGETRQLQDEILYRAPTPIRQIDDTIPAELERICLRGMEKRVADRYATAGDLADDLKHWLARRTTGETTSQEAPAPPVHKGLRAFDECDAGSFLSLVPGARDRYGIPESVRFWRSRIEQQGVGQTFRIGVLLGPSGSGKSSLIRAGLLPHLDDRIRPLHLDAQANGFPESLLARIQRYFPTLESCRTLIQVMQAIRHEQGLPAGRKLLIVIDQFEQWLSAQPTGSAEMLVQGLRQCDGTRIQALLLVRSDFTVEMTRFMTDLDEPILQNSNFAVVESFGMPHARNVLAAFGRACGTVNEPPTTEQEQFLDDAVQEIAVADRIIPVQLALFVEVLKDKPWNQETLRKYGGFQGIGRAFLEDRFEGQNAHPVFRHNSELVRQILTTLLPEDGGMIKSAPVSRSQLIQSTELAADPETLDRILDLLDTEVRLITRTSPTFISKNEAAVCYQLTHDYLVPSLREWLAVRERLTRRGRARLRLQQTSADWNANPQPRRLPTLPEFLSIRALTQSATWTAPQQRMMQVAGRRLLVLGSIMTICLVGIMLLVSEVSLRAQIAASVQKLIRADTAEVPKILVEMKAEWPRHKRALKAELTTLDAAGVPHDSRAFLRRLHLTLALVDDDPEQWKFVFATWDQWQPNQFPIIAQQLRNHPAMETELWNAFETAISDQDAQALKMAAVLSLLRPHDPRWEQVAAAVGELLISVRAGDMPEWRPHFEPIRDQLRPHLLQSFMQDDALSSTQRTNVVELIADYGRDAPQVLASALEDAAPDEFPILQRSLFGNDVAESTLRDRFRSLGVQTPLASNTNSLPSRVLELAESSEGIIRDTGAVVQSLPQESFAEFTDALADSGYCLSSFRPFRSSDSVLVAATWVRDGRRSHAVSGLTAESIESTDKEQAELGLQLSDIAFYTSPKDGQIYHAACWAERSDPESETRFYIDVSGDTHDLRFDEWTKEHFGIVRTALRMQDPATPRYTAIWRKNVEDADEKIRFRSTFGELLSGYLQTECRGILLQKGQRDCLVSDTNRRASWKKGRAEGLLSSNIFKIAQLEMACGNNGEAEKWLAQLSKRNPGHSGISEHLATLLARLGRLEELEVEIRHFAELKSAERWQIELLLLRAALLRSDEADAQTRLNETETLLRSEETSPRLIFANARASSLFSSQPQWKGSAAAKTRCLSLLRQYIDSDKPDVERLLEEQDFDHLRSSAEFESLLTEFGLDRRYCSTWQIDADRESKLLLELHSDEHVEHAKHMFDTGYVPVCITRLDAGESGQGLVSSVWHRRVVKSQERIRLARRRATLAIALAQRDSPDLLLQILKDEFGRESQTHAIELASQLQLTPIVLTDMFREATEPRLQRSIVLALGGCDASKLTQAELNFWNNDVFPQLTQSNDSGLRSAAWWWKRRMQADHGWHRDSRLDVLEELNPGESEIQNWELNTPRQTMIELRPTEPFLMGSPTHEADRGESEELYLTRIPRAYALAATETTREQFQRFLDSLRGKKLYPDESFFFTERYAPASQCPQVSVRWFDAARFCQWLSEEEGIPEDQWCFPQIWEMDESTFTLPANILERNGYRLPTEAEWEYACRGGSLAARSYGDDESLLSAYGWHETNSEGHSHPVGLLKPNDFGFFDMLGNVNEWCLEEFRAYRTPYYRTVRVDVRTEKEVVDASKRRVTRGGYFLSPPKDLRCADRASAVPAYNRFSVGFRIARTID